MMLLAYLRRQWKLLVLLAGIAAVFAAVFSLYDLPVEAVGYAAALCLALGAVLFGLGFRRFCARHRELRRLLDRAEESVLPLPPAGDLLEEDYQALLTAVAAHRTRLLARERDKLAALAGIARPEMQTYVQMLYSMIFELSCSYQSELNREKTGLRSEVERAIEETPRLFPTSAVIACQGT